MRIKSITSRKYNSYGERTDILSTRKWTTKGYPVFRTHGSVKCWNCHEYLSDPAVKRTQYAQGKYVKYCPDCDMYTFYDV